MSDSSATSTRAVRLALKTDIVVIGAGQAGLSSAYHLKRRGLAPNRGFIVLDQSPQPGGAWQFRWPSLKLSTVNRIHDLPGMHFSEVVDINATEVEASVAVPQYYAAYEKAFGLPVYRPIKVIVVCDRGERLRLETDRGDVSARGIINATGTWETPYIPDVPGKHRFARFPFRCRYPSSALKIVGLRWSHGPFGKNLARCTWYYVGWNRARLPSVATKRRIYGTTRSCGFWNPIEDA